MIGPKRQKPTPAEERRAYAIATGRDNDTCQRCLRLCGPSTRDHRQGRGRGGLTVASNLQILGGDGTTGCHGWKTANPQQALEEGWSVPGNADPAEWPAARWIPTQWGTVRKGWVLYDDAGGWAEITEAEATTRMNRNHHAS